MTYSYNICIHHLGSCVHRDGARSSRLVATMRAEEQRQELRQEREQPFLVEHSSARDRDVARMSRGERDELDRRHRLYCVCPLLRCLALLLVSARLNSELCA